MDFFVRWDLVAPDPPISYISHVSLHQRGSVVTLKEGETRSERRERAEGKKRRRKWEDEKWGRRGETRDNVGKSRERKGESRRRNWCTYKSWTDYKSPPSILFLWFVVAVAARTELSIPSEKLLDSLVRWCLYFAWGDTENGNVITKWGRITHSLKFYFRMHRGRDA